MQAISRVQRIRQRKAMLRFLISFIGILAIVILLYLIGHLPVA